MIKMSLLIAVNDERGRRIRWRTSGGVGGNIYKKQNPK